MNKPEYILDGIVLPVPAAGGAVITPNKIWSSNAGRNSSTGKFVGDVVALKYTVSLTYDALSQEQMQILWNAAANLTAWHRLTFPLFDGSSIKTIICYITDPSYTLRRFDMRTKKPVYEGVTIEFIEQ